MGASSGRAIFSSALCGPAPAGRRLLHEPWETDRHDGLASKAWVPSTGCQTGVVTFSSGGPYQAAGAFLYSVGNNLEKEVIQCLIVIPLRVPRPGCLLPA